jgi:hypothetical protein
LVTVESPNSLSYENSIQKGLNKACFDFMISGLQWRGVHFRDGVEELQT